jgi:predicted DNA-binding transcriptional regulator AlpA
MTRFLTWQQLHDLGILPSRQHTRRLIEQGVLPKPYRLGDPDRGRLTWRDSDIEAYIARRDAARAQPRVRTLSTAVDNVVPLRGGSTVPRMILRRPQR